MRDDREPHERWFTPGTGVGLLIGLLIGLALGDLIIGLMVGLILGAGIGVLRNPRTRDGRADRPRPRRGRRGGDEHGAMDRGVMWLLVGLGATAVLLFAAAPELLMADTLELGQLVAVVLAAAVPGLAIIAIVAYRRRNDTEGDEVGDE